MKQCCFGFCREFKEYVFQDLRITFFLYSFDLVRFATRSNVLDLAISIVIGTAFTKVIQSLVDDIITPPLGLVLGGVDFVNLTIKMKNFVYKDQPPVVIRYGVFIQSIMTLFIVAFALFFVVKGMNRLYKMAIKTKKNNADINSKIDISEEVKVLCEIRDLLTRQSTTMQSMYVRI